MGAKETRARMEELRLDLRLAGDEARADCARFRRDRMQRFYDESKAVKEEIWSLSETLQKQIQAELLDGPR